MAIHEVQFPPEISKGAQGGPRYQTIVAPSGAAEELVPQWSTGLLSWDVAHVKRRPELVRELVAFFRCRRGRLHAFRFKDWSDYKAIAEEPVSLGGGFYQCVKRYESGDQTEIRSLSKPVDGSFSLYAGGELMHPDTYDLDLTTGKFEFNLLPGPPMIPKGKSACLQIVGVDDPYLTLLCDIDGHEDDHGREYECYQDPFGYTPMFIEAGPTPEPYQDLGGVCTSHMNGATAVLSLDRSTLHFDMRGCSAPQLALFQETTGGNYRLFYTIRDAGILKRYEVEPFDIGPAPDGVMREPDCGSDLTTTFEFDVPARFDTDQMRFTMDHSAMHSWGQIPIVEVIPTLS